MTAPRLQTLADVAAFIEGQSRMVELLGVLDPLGLPDGWIGAGFLRNPVWDVLHGRAPDFAGLADVDVLFFDPADTTSARERAVEAELAATFPAVPWSARNQARMHARNGDAPYRDTADALSHWLETATAIAARLRGGRVEVLAPYGVADLAGLVLRPTPPTATRPDKLERYRRRVWQKGWLHRWPCLTTFGLDMDAG